MALLYCHSSVTPLQHAPAKCCFCHASVSVNWKWMGHCLLLRLWKWGKHKKESWEVKYWSLVCVHSLIILHSRISLIEYGVGDFVAPPRPAVGLLWAPWGSSCFWGLQGTGRFGVVNFPLKSSPTIRFCYVSWYFWKQLLEASLQGCNSVRGTGVSGWKLLPFLS